MQAKKHTQEHRCELRSHLVEVENEIKFTHIIEKSVWRGYVSETEGKSLGKQT